MSGSTKGCTPLAPGRWTERLSSSFQANYTRRSDGSLTIEIHALEYVVPRPDMIRAQLCPQPTLELARRVARHFVDVLNVADEALAEAARG